MPFGAQFTSSGPTTDGKGPGGPQPFTMFRGQVLVGYPPEPPASGSQTGNPPGGTTGYNGSAAVPLYSFFNRPDTGLYIANQTSSASEMRHSQIGSDMVGFSTAGMVCGWTTGTAAWSTGTASGQSVYIAVSSAQIMTSSGGGVTPAAYGAGAVLVWDAGRNKLCVYSTISGAWLGSAVFTSS